MGSLLRFAIGESAPLVQGTIWSTFMVNVVGCLAIGIVAPRINGVTSPLLHVFVVTGVLGGFTTFSAFAGEIVLTISESGGAASWAVALLYMGATIVVGLLAVPLGVRLGNLGHSEAAR